MVEEGQSNLDDLLDLTGSGESPESTTEDIERTVRDFDRRLNRQLNSVLHHTRFRSLEKAWRELAFLINSVPSGSNVEIEILSVTPEAVMDDLLTAQGLSHTGLFQLLFNRALLGTGEAPYSALVLEWEFGRTPKEVEFLSRMTALGSAVHAPVLIGMAPSFFGVTSYAGLEKVPDLSSRLQGAEYAKWHRLRDEEESRFLVACACGFALRYPHGADDENRSIEGFVEESWRGGAAAVLWGNPAFAMASVLFRAFHESGSLVTLHGVEEGRVDGIPRPSAAAQRMPAPLEVVLPRARGYDFALNGVVLLALPDPERSPCFLSSQTALRPRTFQSRELTVQLLAYSRLPWLFFSSRIAQSLFVLFRKEQWQDMASFQRRIESWVDDHLATEGASHKPFDQAKVEVNAPDDGKGWWLVHLEVAPSVGWEGIEENLHVDVWMPTHY